MSVTGSQWSSFALEGIGPGAFREASFACVYRLFLNYSVIRTHLMKCVDRDEVFCKREDSCGFKATMNWEAQSDYLAETGWF